MADVLAAPECLAAPGGPGASGGDTGQACNGAIEGSGHQQTGVPSALQARLGPAFRGLKRCGSAPPDILDTPDAAERLCALGGDWSGGGGDQGAAEGGIWLDRLEVPEGELSPNSKEQAALSDPAYLQYYYSHKNINPRLPPPRVSGGMTSGQMSSTRAPLGSEGGEFKGEVQPSSLYMQKDVVYSTNIESKSRSRDGGSRLQESSLMVGPWAQGSEPGKGLMGLSPLKPGNKTWDSEYNMNASSPVFGHPSSPFAPIRTKPPPDDAVDFLRSTALGIKTGRQLGLGGYGSAPGTPTKSYFEGAATPQEGGSGLFADDGGLMLNRHLQNKLSTLSSSHSLGSLSAHVQPNLSVEGAQHSQPSTPTLGGAGAGAGYDGSLQVGGLSMQEVTEQMASQHLEPARYGSRDSSPAHRSPDLTPPQMSPPRESAVGYASPRGQRSPGQAAPVAEPILPDNMYPGVGPMPGYASPMPGSPPLPCGMEGLMGAGGMDFNTFSAPMPGVSQHPGVAQQMQAAAAMSMMYPFYAQQQSVQAAALAQAAAMYSMPGMPPAFPPAFNPALLMHAGGGYDLSRMPPPMPPGLPPEYAAYHARMMDFYAQQHGHHGGGGGGSHASAMAAAAAAAAAANDPAAASMAAAAYAAATGGAPLPRSGKTCSEPEGPGWRGGGHYDGPPGHHRRGHPQHREGGGRRDGSRGGRRGEGHRRHSDEDAGGGGHSSLLEQLKSNKAKKVDLQDIAGHVVEFCTDQHGSRFIQLKLESSTPAETAPIFNEVVASAIPLMTDVFGNYVVQKFLEHGSEEQQEAVAEALTGEVLTLSLQMYGCRVVQKALEMLRLERQQMIVAELQSHVMRCVRDQNGNHVIQKCIECVPTPHVAFMVDSFKGQVASLSAHPYGCRVIQRVLEHCSDEARLLSVMEEVLAATCQLAQDQYGNYVVQHVLERGAAADRTVVITQLAGQIVEMSQNKFASNVIEKCLQHGSHSDRQILIAEIIGNNDENGPLQIMMKDQFGNYVVQKLLEVCDDSQREELLARIKASLHNLKKYTYGKHIVARVEKLVTNTQRLLRHSPRPPAGASMAAPAADGSLPPAMVGGP